MYLLSNIYKELNQINFIYVPGMQVDWQNPQNVLKAMEHVLDFFL